MDNLRADLRNERGYSTISGNLAEVEFQACNVEAALELATEAVFARHGRDTSVFLANIAAYLIVLERWDEARTRARESISRARVARTEIDLATAIQHLAAIDALRPHDGAVAAREAHERAARLLGFADGHFQSLRTPRQHTEEQEYVRARAALSTNLGAEFAALLDEGRGLTVEEALAEAWLV